VFVTLQGLEMEIYPETLIPGVDETISVVAIAVHVADVVGRPRSDMRIVT
jgi:hypothetical protein